MKNGEIKFKGVFNELYESKELNLEDLLLAEQSSDQQQLELELEQTPLNREITKNQELLRMKSSTKSLSQQQNEKLSTNKNEQKLDSNKDSEYEEKTTLGALSWKTYFIYFKVGGGVFGALLVFIIFILSQLFVVMADYWVSIW